MRLPYTMNYSTPDLTIHPPRSPRIQLGGVVALPRMIDKCRATLTGKNGEYHFNCPLDQRILNLFGVTAEAFQAEVATGAGDGDIWAWIQANSTTKPSEWEIIQWSEWQASRGPSDTDSREYFHDIHSKIGGKREDISNWFELLDLDYYVSFGGKA